MEISSRIKERVINAALITLFLLFLAVYAAFSQTPADIRNVGVQVKLASNVNPNAHAHPINAAINSPFHELKPALTPCGKRLYFSRIAHPLNTSGAGDLEDIWYTEYDSADGKWTEAIRLPGYLNNGGPNFINSVSNTGDTIILGNQYLKKGKMRSGISYSVNVKGQWTFPEPIIIENDYNISQHANYYVCLKNGVIISSVQRADSQGERDLYVSFWNGEKATEPMNMGGVINTAYEESSPFLSSDLKSLYFASKGHNGYGGYDIYVTRRLDDSWTNWTEPENLGPAVNGPLDDEFFSITHCGQFAIFSKQVSIHNVDLFKISLDDLFKRTGEKPRSKHPEQSVLAAL